MEELSEEAGVAAMNSGEGQAYNTLSSWKPRNYDEEGVASLFEMNGEQG